MEKKRLILSKLQDYGVKNCSWINTLHQAVEDKSINSERLRCNLYTRIPRLFCYVFFFFSEIGLLCRSCLLLGRKQQFAHPRAKIFELKGIECDGATDIEKDEILEELLKEAENQFKYERHVEKHRKFSCLNKYLFKYTEGQTETAESSTSKKMESWVSNLKKGNELSLEFLGKSSATATSSEGVEKVSESFKTLSDKLKELNQLRAKLRTNSEELLFIQASIQKVDDPSWSKKLDEVGTAVQVLEEFLKEVRASLAEGLPSDKTGDYQEKVAQLNKIVDQCGIHQKASGQIIKQTKQLLGTD